MTCLHLLNKLLNALLSDLLLRDFLHHALLIEDELPNVVPEPYAIKHDLVVSFLEGLYLGHVEALAFEFRELGLTLGKLDLEVGKDPHEHVAQVDVRSEDLFAM